MTGKNKGENLKLLMEKENLKNCIYVGDTRMDEVACRYAGFLLYGRLTVRKNRKTRRGFVFFLRSRKDHFDALKIYTEKKSKKSKKIFS